jgi:REG-2-like HAD superfamily hydrolase
VTTRAVFFDAGETLVHPHPTFAELFARILEREGHQVDAGVVGDRVMMISERFAQAARDNELWTTAPERSKAFWISVYESFLDGLGIPSNAALCDRIYREFTDLSNYVLFDDVVPVLERLARERLTLGVVSNFEEWLELLLEELDVKRFLTVRVISGIEGVEKPDPRLFLLALERAGVTAAETVYVGDNPMFDVEPARALGMLPVLIDRRGRHPDLNPPRITSMAQLPPLLGFAA